MIVARYNSTIGVYADFIDVRNYSNATSTAAVYIFKDQWTNFQILPCSILAHWVPVSMWLDPRTDNLVYEDSPDPIDALNRSEYHNLSATTQVVIPPSWTSAINNILVYDPPPLAHMAKNFGVHYSVDPPLYVIQGRQKIPWQIATTLGLYVADSLARVNYLQAPNASIVMHDPNNGSIPFVRELDDLNAGNLIFPLGNYMAAYGINEVDPRPYYDTDEVTAFSLEVQRFGYAWSTRSITVKLAATVLLLQATLAIGHLVILLITSWTSNSWRSAGELLALASRRGNTGRLRNVGGGIERINTWKGIVKVRSEGFTGEMVELLVDKDIFDNTMTRLYGDKKYS